MLVTFLDFRDKMASYFEKILSPTTQTCHQQILSYISYFNSIPTSMNPELVYAYHMDTLSWTCVISVVPNYHGHL